MVSPEPRDGLLIRQGSLADLERLEELEAHFPGDRLARSQLRHLLTRAHALVLVAEDGAGIVGSAVVLYRRGFASARLYSLVVDPRARGRGVGGRLLEAVEEDARERACVSLRLEVREDNEAAIALYRRSGYEVVGRTADYYEDGSSALRMRKHLRPARVEKLSIPYYPQSLDFTCGPAALMMAMRGLGYSRPLDQRLEMELWREATTVFMLAGHGGCSPYGLACAALRRGFAAEVVSRDAAVPFLDTVRLKEKKQVVELTHRNFERDLVRLGGSRRLADFGHDDVAAALSAGSVPIVMVSGYRLYQEKIPHWVVATGFDAEHLYFHDPFIPEGAARADGVHLPLARGDFEALSRFGRARHRYMVLVGPPGASAGGASSPAR